MLESIAIVIPLPPTPRRYLELIPDLLHSISAQTRKPDEVVIVYDGFNVKEFNMHEIWESHSLSYATGAWMRYFNVPARVGVPNAFNIGVGVAESQLVLMVGADDILHPDCIARCLDSYELEGKRDGFYWINVAWEDGRPYNLPCGHAMVTKKFWKDIGGYPLESPGACDAALISMIWGSEELIAVGGEPLITVRRDTTTYTGSRDPRWTDIIIQQRELLVQLHKEKLMNIPEQES